MSQRDSWLGTIAESAQLRALAQAVRADRSVIADGSRGSSTPLLAGALALESQRPVLLVVAHLDESDDALDDLELYRRAGYDLSAERFGALEVLPGESNISLELLAERLGVVSRIAEGQLPNVLVAPVQALMQPVPTPEAIGLFARGLRVGQTVSPNDLIHWLGEAGYVRQDAIEQPGDFAVRGGIIDIFAPAGELIAAGQPSDADASGGPVRIDYFGDEIESIHRIDPETMGSTDKLTSVRLIGAAADQVQSDDNTANLIDLLPEEFVVVLHEVLELSEQARGYYERLTNPAGIASPNTVFHKLVKRPTVQVHQYSTAQRKPGRDLEHVDLPVAQLMSFDQDGRAAIQQLGELAADPANHVIVLCQKDAERDRLRELLTELAPEHADNIDIDVGSIHHGFVWSSPDRAVQLVPHHELFHRYETRRRIRRISADATVQAGDAFLDLEVGDHVVHIDHGIARFVGLKMMRPKRKGDAPQEYLTLEFAGNALLHVPATQIELVQKYIGGFEGKPPLSTLGGKRWSKQKESVQEAVRDLAKELLRVQAARQTMPGIRYPADTAWQKEFEAEFPYDETEDQLAAIAAVKRDMSESRPMDRLICGDVGFGKTEVAIRAAFKAVEFGNQVAVLVPTTVLAEQHERTFRGRMADYPFRVESISRFKTGGEQTKLLRELAEGRIDIIIGTHRLLSKDVHFADLGLVVIDEEQRFGVEHKQRLLEFRLTADVLTLTATPIPRTLHMAMIGLRDISSLSTPPVDRRAIVTEVVPYEKQRVQQAIIRELNREGQVFFVHNRVYNIQSVADDIRRLVPDARIIIGHGQMPSRQLEDVMLRFIRQEANVLVCTTIIESGIDIPTANTMFIHQADHFGLADLHQLRGRVGRYKHRAYCYLLLPEDRPVTETATKRLRAIEQYSMLGAGFKIAMRDLEIRGAGNLLGAEQSGHIAAVGYEMYCLLLERETKRLKSEPIIEPVKTHIELPIAGALPKRYIRSDKFRMEVYRRLSRASTFAELESVAQSMHDAYGDPPPPAKRLLDLTELRIAAALLDIRFVKLEDRDLIFKTGKTAQLQNVFRDAPGRVSVLDEQTVYYRPPSSYLSPPETLLAILRKMLTTPLRGAPPATAAAS